VFRRIILAAALTAALGSLAIAQPERPLIRVGSGQDDQITPLLYAQHAGLFARAGLNVEVTKMANGATAAAAVAGGSLEIAKASSFALVLAHVKGIPFVLIAPAGGYRSEAPNAAFIVAASSPMRVAKDLNGKTLGATQLGDINHISTMAWIDQNGGDASTVKFVEIPPLAIPAAIEAGRIDGATVFEPTYSSAVNSGKARVMAYSYDAIAKHFEDSAFYANATWIAGHRDLVVRFNRVVHDANAYLAGHESEGVPLIAQFVGVDPATLPTIHHPDRPLYLDPNAIQPVIDGAFRYKVIPARFAAQEMICDCALKPPR